MNSNQFLNGLSGRFILSLFVIAFGFGNIYAQHLFSVNYSELPRNSANLIRTELARSDIPVSTMQTTKNQNNRDVYAFSLSSVQNSRIVILNEETGRSIVITPAEDAPAQFELPPFFIEELRQATLGDADQYLVIETDADFSIKNVASVSAARREVFIPRYFYGRKENVKEALPKDRQIIHIFKQKPRIIPAFPDDPEHLRLLAELEEEMSYYVYMYQLPDGTLIIFDEHFVPRAEKNQVSTNIRTTATPSTCCTNLQFNLSGNLTGDAHTATLHALGIWSDHLAGIVPIDIEVSQMRLSSGIGASFVMPDWLCYETYTWYPTALANQIAGYNVAPGMLDILIGMRMPMDWYYPATGNPSGDQSDWITVVLHEITHGLGFRSFINNDGVYRYGAWYGYDMLPTAFPCIFTRQLYQGTTGLNITELNQTQRAALVVSRNMYAGQPNSYLLEANSGERVKIYAPTAWSFGSSVSHWDSSVTFPTFMKPGYNQLSLSHIINEREIAIMRDMGWRIPCPPHVNFNQPDIISDDTITSCGDINIEGVTISNDATLTLVAAGDINVQNVTVTSGATLILDAGGEVNVISDLDIQTGADYEVW